MNKVKVMLCGVCVMLTCLSCTNTNTVNVLISNRGDGDCRDKCKKSQKTYSVNRKDMSLSDNLFRFRSENIYIDVK